MRASARSIIVLALCIAAPWLANAEPYILDLSGRNYSTSEAQAIGQELEIVGLVTQGPTNPPFQLPGISDWSTEYTVHVNGLTLADPTGQPVKNYSAGTIELWVAIEAALGVESKTFGGANKTPCNRDGMTPRGFVLDGLHELTWTSEVCT